jgi:hypothetical protein
MLFCIIIGIFVFLFLYRFIFSASDKHSLAVKLEKYLEDEKAYLKVKDDEYNIQEANFQSQLSIDKDLYLDEGSFDNMLLKENEKKNKMLFCFVNDYCRASPYLNVNESSNVYNLGWRSDKSSVLIDYETYDYNIAESKQVSLFCN